MAIINGIRPFLWAQTRGVCVLAFTQIQALSIQQSALSPRNSFDREGGQI